MAASPRVMGAITSDRCLMGDTSISMAVMKATKPPTVAPPVLLCHSAAVITQDRAMAAMIWVMGVMVPEAMAAFITRRRNWLLRLAKRSPWWREASCRRTMRQASTFSSTV